MDVTVYAGSTEVKGASTPISLTFHSPQGERACLLIQSDAKESQMESFADECAGIIRHSLLSVEGEAWHRMDGTLKELNGLFKGLQLSNALEEVHAVVAILEVTGALHVSHAGRGEAYLVRGGVASQITEFSPGKPVPAFVHISTGQLEEGDAVVLSTHRLLRTFTPATLGTVVSQEGALEEITATLEAEAESAALAIIQLPGGSPAPVATAKHSRTQEMAAKRQARRGRQPGVMGILQQGFSYLAPVGGVIANTWKKFDVQRFIPSIKKKPTGFIENMQEKAEQFLSDLRNPKRRKRAQLLLLAGAVAVFLVIWMLVSLSTVTQRSKTKSELSQILTEAKDNIRVAENRKLAGDTAGASEILDTAENKARQVVNNESRLYTTEALDLLDQIRQKQEELSNTARVSPRVVVNLSSKNSNVSAQGLIGLGDGEFVVFDRQYTYRVLLNTLDEPRRVSEGELLLLGAPFERFNAQIYMTTGNSLSEVVGNQATMMKTEDPQGWKEGVDIETYLRYLYLLAPKEKQIYKYEHLQNRYGPPVGYNVNADLADAVDMSIDGSVYVLKEGGVILKLLRGEAQPFTLRGFPKDVLKTATKIFKVPNGNIYVLDPVNARVVVIADGGATGEATYVRQYLLEGEQLGTLKDLYVDPDQNHLYVIDEKRVYAIDIGTR